LWIKGGHSLIEARATPAVSRAPIIWRVLTYGYALRLPVREGVVLAVAQLFRQSGNDATTGGGAQSSMSTQDIFNTGVNISTTI